jgi:hypothetical protein
MLNSNPLLNTKEINTPNSLALVTKKKLILLNNKKITKRLQRNSIVFENITPKSTKPQFKVVTNKPTHFSFTSKNTVYECKHCLEHKKGYKAHPFYYVNTIKLNTVILQYLIDNNLLSFYKKDIIGNNNDNIYIGFNDFQGLVVTEHTKVNSSNSPFMLIYEKEYNPAVDLINPFDRKKLLSDIMEKQIFSLSAYIYDIDNPDDDSNPVVLSTEIIYLKYLLNKLNAKYNKKDYDKTACDSIDDEYSIIKELSVDSVGDVIIVAYPTPEMYQFLKNEKLMAYYRKAYKVFEHYEELLIGLYNAFEKSDKQISNVLELLTQSPDFKIINSEDFTDPKKPPIDALPLLKQIQVLTSLFDQEFTDGLSTEDKIKLFKKKVMEKIMNLYKTNTNLLNNPNFSLDYVIHHFIKTPTGVEPMIYSIRELEPKHLSVLQATQDIIEIDLPKLFGIITPSSTERFISFYSYYRYGDIFHIKVAKIEDTELFPHIYKRSINLDELIYTCQIPEPYGLNYWKKYKRVFSIRENLIKLSNRYQRKMFPKLDVYNRYNPESIALTTRTKHYNRTMRRTSTPKKIDNYEKMYTSLFNDVTILKTLVKPYGETEIYYMTKENVYYYLRILPNLENLDPQMIFDLFKNTDNNISKQIYQCSHQNNKTVSYNLPIFKILEGPTQITESFPKKKNLFKKNIFSFPYLKQLTPNYNFLDQFTLSINNKKKYSDYFIYLIYNLFQIAKSEEYAKYQSEGNLDFSNENPNCLMRVCNYTELDGFKYFKVKNIMVNGIIHYVLVIQKIKMTIQINKKKFDVHRYIVWIYDTSKYKKTKLKDIELKIDENRCRSIYQFNGKDLKLIYDALKTDTDIFKNYTIDGQLISYHPTNMIINLTTTANTDHFHIQILPISELYKNDIYAEDFSSITESRSKQLRDILAKLEQYPDYYSNLSNVTSPPKMITNLNIASL